MALGRHPVAAIHSTPCAVRCTNARRKQRHKIQSSARPARSSWRTGWRGALPLLPLRFIHQELPSCAASRVKRWRQHRRDPATEVSRGPRITHKTGETPTEVTFALAIPTSVLRDDLCDTSLHVKYASMASWKRITKINTHTHVPCTFSCNCAPRHTQNMNSGPLQHARNLLHFLSLDSTNMRMSVPLMCCQKRSLNW